MAEDCRRFQQWCTYDPGGSGTQVTGNIVIEVEMNLGKCTHICCVHMNLIVLQLYCFVSVGVVIVLCLCIGLQHKHYVCTYPSLFDLTLDGNYVRPWN